MQRLSSEYEDRAMEVVSFPIFSGDLSEKNPNKTAYSDRLRQFDRDKYKRLCEKHFGEEVQGRSWRGCDSEDVESFLRDWTGEDNLELVRVSTQNKRGYEIFRFDYYSPKRRKKAKESEFLEVVSQEN